MSNSHYWVQMYPLVVDNIITVSIHHCTFSITTAVVQTFKIPTVINNPSNLV